MRLTYPTATVLYALAYGHTHGFDIIDVTGLGAGTVYPILRRLEAEGLVQSEWERAELARAESRPPRRNYRMTPEGQRVAVEVEQRFPPLARQFGPLAGETGGPP